MIPKTQEEAAVVAVDETATEATQVAETAPAATKPAKKKVVAKKKAKAAPAALSDSDYLAQLLAQLYALRANTKMWANLTNSTKEGEALHKLLSKQPVYRWREVGVTMYLEAKHTGNDNVVAFVLPIDPQVEFSQSMREYKKALENLSPKAKTQPVKPEKPSSMRRCFQWHIAARKGDDTQGTSPTLEQAIAEINSRKALFIV